VPRGKSLGKKKKIKDINVGSSQCSFAMNIQFCGLKSLALKKKKKKKKNIF
jgi:hypothetical protein